MASTANTDAAMRLLLQKTAHLHYSRLGPGAKATIREGFFRLDESEDGRISLREFMQAANGYDDAQVDLVPKLFRFLDADSSGFLEFDEYITLHYLLEAGLHVCDSCSAPIMMLGYTCMACLEERSTRNAGELDTFDLCYNCYASRTFVHHHDALIDNNTMYNIFLSKTNDAPQKQVQCAICGDFHRKDIQSALVPSQNHVMKIEEPSNNFICEWCSSWLCNNCGEFFQGSSATSAPNKWLRTNICCSSCRVHGTTTNLAHVFEALENTEASRKCSTCAIKIKRGILWATYKGSPSSPISAEEIYGLSDAVSMKSRLAR